MTSSRAATICRHLPFADVCFWQLSDPRIRHIDDDRMTALGESGHGEKHQLPAVFNRSVISLKLRNSDIV
jgi:hypothetical protein